MFGDILLANLLISAVSFSGLAIFSFKKVATENIITHLVSFAAGVMLTAAILDLLPESLEIAQGKVDIFLPLFCGVIVFFFLERFLLWFHHHHGTHGIKPAPLLVLFGDGIHNGIDGVAIAATFLANPALGFVTTLAIAAHEIPQEIADFSVLIYGGFSKKKALAANFISGLTAVLGGILGFYFLDKIEGILPVFLAFTAGMFIYISCADLIPELHRDFEKRKNWGQSIAFLLGILVLFVTVKLLEN